MMADVINNQRVRAAVLWPHQRLGRVRAWLSDPTTYEPLDGLSRLADYGIDIEVVDPYPFPLNPFAHRGTLLAGTDFLRAIKVLTRYSDFHVIISVGESPAFWLILAARHLGFTKPIIIIDPALSDTYSNRRRLQRIVLPRSDRIVVYGTVQSHYLYEEYGARARVVFLHHRMDTDFFDGKARGPLPVRPGTIVSVGDDNMRDFETLCRAVSGTTVPVQIYTRKPIACRIPDNVEVIRRWVSYGDLREIYLQSCIVVVPIHSVIHASGINALLEAMAMGKPVVVSASKGISDYITHGETAWVVPPNDPDRLRDGILRLLRSPDLSQSLGQNARAFCERECALPVYAGRVAQVIREVASNNVLPK
jgi:glycosyltransferase involved in cell wall biosynthesis